MEIIGEIPLIAENPFEPYKTPEPEITTNETTIENITENNTQLITSAATTGRNTKTETSENRTLDTTVIIVCVIGGVLLFGIIVYLLIKMKGGK